MKKQNKILVAVCPDDDLRRKLIQKIAMECGFALTASDAAKLIKPSAYEYQVPGAYFVIADTHDFRRGMHMNQMLYEMAARGMAVILGVKKLPAEYEFICETYYTNYL